MRAFVSLAAALLAGPGLLAQGSLTPPGAPVPSMKSLGQIEPRVVIEKVPFKITAPGSYYLAANLTVPKGSAGIEISAGNVTLDLGGFILKGEPESGQGIVLSGGVSDVAIRGGVLSGLEAGVDAAGSTRLRVEKVRVINCAGFGLIAGADAVITDCQAHENESGGIKTGPGSQILNCLASANFGHGFEADAKSVLRDCVATRNGMSGIVAGNSSKISSCSSSENSGSGILGGIGAHLSDSVANGNRGEGVALGANALVSDVNAGFNVRSGIKIGDSGSVLNSTASGNGWLGLLAGVGAQIAHCKADANAGGGIFAGKGSTIRECTVQRNLNDGITVSDECMVLRNHATGNSNFRTASGIHATGTDNVIQENNTTSNDRGIAIDVEGNFIVKNTASSNSINFALNGEQSIGPIATSPDGAEALHPMTNFAY